MSGLVRFMASLTGRETPVSPTNPLPVTSAGVDSNGNALPASFDSVGGVTTYTPNSTAPTSKTWVKVIAPYTYTQTTTYAYSGSDVTSKTVSDWVRS